MTDGLLRTIQISGFRGLYMLSCFLDGTACPDGPQFAGVAAVIFDEAGLNRFRDGYRAIRDEFKKDFGLDIGVFHATDCCGRRGYGLYAGWMPELRIRLCNQVAQLVAESKIYGIIHTALKSEFDAKNDVVRKNTGGPYPLALIGCLEHAASMAKDANQQIFFLIEKGDNGQKFADSMLNRIRDTELLRKNFAYFAHVILPKGNSEDALPLLSADFLAWECKNNFEKLTKYMKNDDCHDDSELTQNFKILRGDDPLRWREVHTIDRGWEAHALVNKIIGLV